MFPKKMPEDIKYPREHFFYVCCFKKHAIRVSFIPGSNAYKNYGSDLTIDALFKEEEIGELAKNCFSNPPIRTKGLVKAKVLVDNGLAEYKVKFLAAEGFSTDDVLQTMHLH